MKGTTDSLRIRSGLLRFGVAIGVVALLVTRVLNLAAQVPPPDPKAGLYAIWYNDSQQQFLDQPYVVGGQIVLQWAKVEPRQGCYDFSAIDKALADFAQRGKYTTLQINGNVKPAWLFEKVPFVGERLSVQVGNRQGTLMYWHPTHREAYLAMLRALGTHLDRVTHRERLVGIRMNFNALGTEHHYVSKEFASPDAWTVPAGVDRAALVAWTKTVDDAYVQAVLDTYIQSFRGSIRIFVRNNIGEDLVKAYRADFDDGTLSWFHTSSEVEPRATFAELKYGRFHDDCRSGHTTAYAEPWASAWGHHGGQTDDRWCSPPQWNYWRLLFDLHCGVSYIALYSSDMRVAVEGRYRSQGVELNDLGGAYQAEFNAAFRFAEKYAGHHASPATSPGAWVAFRENHIVRAANGIPESRRELSRFTGDYSFLMRRLPGDKTRGLDVVKIGPDDQRYGAWARVLLQGELMRLALNPRFAASLDGTDVAVLVVFLDAAEGAIEVGVSGRAARTRLTGTGRWREVVMPASGTTLANDKREARIEVAAGEAPVYLHMVEVVRSSAEGATGQ